MGKMSKTTTLYNCADLVFQSVLLSVEIRVDGRKEGIGMKVEIPKRLPVLLVSDSVLFPSNTVKVSLKAHHNVTVVEETLGSASPSLNNFLVFLGYKTPSSGRSSNSNESVTGENLHPVGTVAFMSQIVGRNYPRTSFVVRLTGICRARIDEVTRRRPYFVARISQLDHFLDSKRTLTEKESKVGHLAQLVDSNLALIARDPTLARNIKAAMSANSLETLLDLLCSAVDTHYEEKLGLLAIVDLKERLEKVYLLLKEQVKTEKENERDSKEKSVVQILPETVRGDGFWNSIFGQSPNQLPPIGGMSKPQDKERDELARKIESAGMPAETLEICKKELRRLSEIPFSSPESSSLRHYLELMAELPWSKSSEDKLDVISARKQLEEDHFGLKDVKKRILEFLAVRQLKKTSKGPILCFVGPPGVGKTSVAKSIAKAMGRTFERISLGGINDQSDIRGHRRTYVSSMPGRIIEGIKRAGTNNPVMLLDEIDKMRAGNHGDPAAALLEVLDPAQNHTFTDHYLNVAFDLSKVLFVATANSLPGMPPALLDRMELIRVPGYTLEEKVEIGRRFVLPRMRTEHGLKESDFLLDDKALRFIAQRYTKEAGVRGLERRLSAVCRAVALRVLEMGGRADSIGKETFAELPIIIDEKAIEDIIGQPLFDSTSRELLSQPGVAAGLAWTPLGGEVLYVEAMEMEGEGRLVLTGQLGDVMKESARVALTWLKSHASHLWKEPEKFSLGKVDLHIHFPAGAVSKDGPSAGVTVLAALASLFSGKRVRSDTAMTGEITLRGLVLPVGGVKEKLLAAYAAGFSRILLPRNNEKDLADLPVEVKNGLNIVCVTKLSDVLECALENGESKSSDKKLKSRL